MMPKSLKKAYFTLILDLCTPLSYILKIGVINRTVRDRVEGVLAEAGSEIPVLIVPEFYFRDSHSEPKMALSDSSSSQYDSELAGIPEPPPNFERDDPLFGLNSSQHPKDTEI